MNKQVSFDYCEMIADVIKQNPSTVNMLVFETYSVAGYDPEYMRVIREVPVKKVSPGLLTGFLNDEYCQDDKYTLGLCSKVGLYSDLHLPILDFDYGKLVDHTSAKETNKYICKVAHTLLKGFKQNSVCLMQSSPRGVHIVGSTPVPWSTYETLLTSFLGIDKRYVHMTLLRKYGTVRIANCERKPEIPTLLCVIRKAGN